jgi:hypothetical protein
VLLLTGDTGGTTRAAAVPSVPSHLWRFLHPLHRSSAVHKEAS